MNKKVLIGSLLCTVGFSSIFGFSTGFAFDFFGSSSVDLPLKDVSFTSGGDMQGSFHGMSVRDMENGSALVCYEDASWHHEAISVKEYIVPVSLLDDIKTVFNNNKLVRCEKAPKSKYQILDGATRSYSFYFEKRPINFSSTQELPKECNAALREISKCVASACEKGQRLPGLVLEKDAIGNMPLRTAAVKGALAIKAVGYKNKILTVSIGNGTEEEKAVALQAKIFEVNKPENIVAEQITDQITKVPAHYDDDYRWELDKRLEAGKYCLTLGGYSTEFEIK